MRTRAHHATPGDDVRRAAVIVSVVLAVCAGLWNREPLDPSATLLAPAEEADLGRYVLLAGLAVLATYQTLPLQAARARMRATGWWVAGAALALAVAQTMPDGAVTGGAMVLAAAAFLGAAAGLVRDGAERRTEALTVDLVVGLGVGWSLTTAASTVAAVLADAGHPVGRTTALAVVGALGLAVVVVAHWAAARTWLAAGTGLGAAWMLGWIAVARFADVPGDETVAVAAAGIASIAFVSPWVSVLRERPVG
ncbi:hypothetical protein [Paraoerskovia marina]|nr:hypothetical protein [Paraoerskovia marina]